MARSSVARCLIRLVALLSIVLAPRPVSANVARPWSDGDPAGEPGGIPEVAIAHEDLLIDLRPLASGGRVAVAAKYKLDNAGTAKHLDLVFVSGAVGLRDVRVTLDGAPIATHADKDAKLPHDWRPPATTPALGGVGGFGFELAEKSVPFAFALDLPPGRHELAASYTADAMGRHTGDPTLVRQFAYVLAPARTWQSFGGLDLTVQVPPGWDAAATPALKRDGDTLHASFPDVPADAVGITAQARAPLHTPVRVLLLLALGVVTIGGAVRIDRSARKRRDSGKAVTLVTALGLGVAWSLAFFAAGCLAIFGPDATIPAGTASHYGYERILALMFLTAAAALVWAIGIAIAYLRGRPAIA